MVSTMLKKKKYTCKKFHGKTMFSAYSTVT